jgi:mannosyltransferase
VTRTRPREWHLVAALVVAAAALRFSTLSVQSFWLDEAVTARLVRHGFFDMLSKIPGSESTPPLYYALLWPWSRVFGEWEVGLRSLSALAGTALVPVVYLIGRDLVSRRAGLIAAGLTAVNPLLVWYSQEARAYMLFALLAGASFLLFERALRSGARWQLAGWALVSAAALVTHYFALFVVLPEALWLLMRARPRRGAVMAVGSVALAGAAVLPLAVDQSDAARAHFITGTSLASRVIQVPKQYLIGYDAPAEVVLAAAAGALALYGGWLLLQRATPEQRRGAALPAAVAGLALVVPLVMALAGADYLITRNLIAALPLLLVAVAAGFAASRAGLAAAAALAAISLVAVIAVDVTPSYQRDDWRAAARAIGPPGPPRAVVVFPGAGNVPLGLYLHASPFPRVGVPVGEIASVAVATRGSNSQEELQAVNVARTAAAPSGFTLAERRMGRSYTLVRWRAPRPVVVVTQGLLASQLGPRSAVLLQRKEER